jgi:hypothetical protein
MFRNVLLDLIPAARAARAEMVTVVPAKALFDF